VLWRQLRKKRRRRPKTAPLAPITIRFAPRVPLALPPSANPPAGQGQSQRTLVWPPPETSFVEQKPPPLPGQPGPYEQAPWEQPTMVDLRWDPPVGAPEPQAVPPPAQSAAGRHAGPARHPDIAQHSEGSTAQENGRAPGKRRKPQQ
jgi:hypothetical protein